MVLRAAVSSHSLSSYYSLCYSIVMVTAHGPGHHLEVIIVVFMMQHLSSKSAVCSVVIYLLPRTVCLISRLF